GISRAPGKADLGDEDKVLAQREGVTWFEGRPGQYLRDRQAFLYNTHLDELFIGPPGQEHMDFGPAVHAILQARGRDPQRGWVEGAVMDTAADTPFGGVQPRIEVYDVDSASVPPGLVRKLRRNYRELPIVAARDNRKLDPA